MNYSVELRNILCCFHLQGLFFCLNCDFSEQKYLQNKFGDPKTCDYVLTVSEARTQWIRLSHSTEKDIIPYSQRRFTKGNTEEVYTHRRLRLSPDKQTVYQV